MKSFRSWSRNSRIFMDSAGSLPRSQELDTALYLNQMNPVHTLTPYCSKFRFNIFVPSTPISKVASLHQVS